MSSESLPAEAETAAHDVIGRATARFRAAIAVATFAMLVLSWPLWLENDHFPRVPFLSLIPSFPRPLAWGIFGLILICLAAVTAGIRWRTFLSLSLGLLLVLIAQDQHRFQPWTYQYLVIGVLLAGLPSGTALHLVRWWYVSVYLHSGLSKLDVSFVNELGSLFLQTAARPFGLTTQSWPLATRLAATLAMPAGEIVIAFALLWPKTRRLGIAGAIALHAILIGILGPLGLKHSTIVLVWNLAMMIEVPLVFGVDATRPLKALTPGAGRATLEALIKGVFVVALLLPLAERWGWIDAWPAHALYASHVGRTEVYVHEDEVEDWPAEIRRHLLPGGLDSWRRLDLTGWSRDLRGVPVYPQSRACNGLAEALAARYGGRLVRVVEWGPADRMTGSRSRSERIGLESIRDRGDGFRLNAHPAGVFLRGSDGKTEPPP